MDDFYYRKLSVYQTSLQLVEDVYALTKYFPVQESYALTNQIQRAVISIPSNIAEGMGRFSLKERIHFLEIASGSLMEVMCQLEIAQRIGYITNSQFEIQEESIIQISKMLINLRKTFNDKINSINSRDNENGI